MKIAIVRFGNVFNSNGSVAEKFRSKLLKVKKIIVTDPEVRRYFMSGEEASNLIISALQIIFKSKDQKLCRTFVCDIGKPIKIEELAKKMIFLSGRSTKIFIKKLLGIEFRRKKEEVLVSKNEKIINIYNKKILEIKKNKNFAKILKIDFNKFIKAGEQKNIKRQLLKIFS